MKTFLSHRLVQPLSPSSPGWPLGFSSRGAVMLLALLVGWLAFSDLQAQPAVGTVQGRVFNAANNNALANARVTIEGIQREAITDESGFFRIPNVPAGPVSISVVYLGLQPQTAKANLPAGGMVEREFELLRAEPGMVGDTVRLAEFTVVADSEMSAQAIAVNEQRLAPNIKNVVALDEYGDRGDENVGEFLRFLPGVSLNDSGHVPNEVTLRGFPANTSGILLDGGEIAGARGGNTRTVSLLEVPMSNVSRIEVTKVPTPDMSASGLGGSINLISKSGFEVRRPRGNYRVYGMFHDRNGYSLKGGPRNHVSGTSPSYVQPSFALNYLYPVNRKLALTVSASRTWRQKPMERGADADETANWNLVNLFQRTSEWQSLAQVLKTWSASAGAEWRFSSTDRLSFSVQRRESDSYITRSNFSVNYGTGATGDATFTQGAANGVGSVTQGSGANQDIGTETTHFTLAYRHRGDRWRIDAGGSFSQAESAWRDIERGHFNTTPANITNLVIRGEGIPDRRKVGIIPTRYSAVNRSGVEVDLYDGGNYSLGSGQSVQNDYATDRLTGKFDVARDFEGDLSFSIKVGAAIDREEREQRRYLKTWNFRPNGASSVAARQAANFDVFDDAYNQAAPAIYGRPMRWISQKKVYELFQQRPDWFVLDEPLAHQNLVNNSRKMIETVSAAYVRTDFRLLQNRLWIVGGVRFEKTENKGWGPLDDITAQYLKNAAGELVLDGSGNPIPLSSDPLELRKLRYRERGAFAGRDYHDFYPSLSLTYNISDNLVLRAGYARTLGRPNLNFIIPGTTISDPDAAEPTITVNNQGLTPWTADNYDLTLESYYIKDGRGSIGVFQKNIQDFFAITRTAATPELLALYGLPVDEVFLGYDISTRYNAGEAKITGLEFSYQQNLTFLPDWARGFRAYFNGTWMELGGPNQAEFVGFNPSSFAFGLDLIRARYAIKLSCVYQGETRRSLAGVSVGNGIPANTYNYQGERTRWNLSGEYSLSRRYHLYASVTDLGGGFRPLSLRYTEDTPEYAKGVRYQELGYYITLGVRGSF